MYMKIWENEVISLCRQSSALTQRLMVTFQIWNCFKVFFFAAPLALLHRVYISMCVLHRFHVIIIGVTGTACSTLGVQLYFFCCSSSCGWCCSTPFPPSSTCTKRKTGRQCPWFFKAVRLVNALIFMLHHWINHCGSIAPFKQTSAQLSHEPTFLFSLFLIFYSESVSLCFVLAAQAGQRSGWSWQGFSVLLKDTLADWVLATVGLEPSYPALQPQHWQLIWISKSLFYTEYFYLALLFLDFLKRQRVINGFYLQIGNYNNSGNA